MALILIFFNGNFLENLVIQIISFLGALIVAYQIFFSSKVNEKKKESDRLFDILTFVKKSLQLNITPIKNQITYVQDLLDKLKEKKIIDLHVKNNTSIDFVEWTKGVDMIEIKNAYFEHFNNNALDRNKNEENKTKIYDKLVKVLLQQIKTAKVFEENFKLAMEETNKFEQMFDEGKTIIFEMLDVVRYTYTNAQNKHLLDFEKDIMTAVNNHYAIEDTVARNDMYSTMENLIKPLLPLYEKYSNKHELIRAIRQCHFAFDSYEKSKTFSTYRFTNYKESLEESLASIHEIISTIESVESEREISKPKYKFTLNDFVYILLALYVAIFTYYGYKSIAFLI